MECDAVGVEEPTYHVVEMPLLRSRKPCEQTRLVQVDPLRISGVLSAVLSLALLLLPQPDGGIMTTLKALFQIGRSLGAALHMSMIVPSLAEVLLHSTNVLLELEVAVLALGFLARECDL